STTGLRRQPRGPRSAAVPGIAATTHPGRRQPRRRRRRPLSAPPSSPAGPWVVSRAAGLGGGGVRRRAPRRCRPWTESSERGWCDRSRPPRLRRSWRSGRNLAPGTVAWPGAALLRRTRPAGALVWEFRPWPCAVPLSRNGFGTQYLYPSVRAPLRRGWHSLPEHHQACLTTTVPSWSSSRSSDMARKPIESFAQAQRIAKRRMPGPVYRALISGNEKGETMRENPEAFSQIGWLPRVARDAPEEQPLVRELETTSLGMKLSMPVMAGPAGAQAIHPDAEVAVARAAKEAGTAIGLSSFATKPMEEIAAANSDWLYQLYWTGSRDDILYRIERAKKSGAKALIVTLDATGGGLGRRDWGSPPIPTQVDLQAVFKFAPMALSRPGWIAMFLANGQIRDLSVLNSADAPGADQTFAQIYGELMSTPVPTWSDVQWLREQWDGQFVIKGLYRGEEAKRAVDLGADAVVVSNHGGNNLDSTYPTIRVLPAVARAVNGQAEVWFDGGIRRGMDVA